MGNPDVALDLSEGLLIIDLLHGPGVLSHHHAFGVEHRNAAGVVASILQASDALKEIGGNISVADDAADTAHSP